jgi:hypothetical protein
LKGIFTFDDLDQGGAKFMKELEDDLKAECGKLGKVVRIKVYENNPDGYV